jgi:hypothetical protein
MARASIVSHYRLEAMLPPNVKFNQGDAKESKGGFISRGSGGLEPPS